jgi:hypothetical protein
VIENEAYATESEENTHDISHDTRPLNISCSAWMADVLDITKTGFLVITLTTLVSSGLRPSAITRPACTKDKYKKKQSHNQIPQSLLFRHETIIFLAITNGVSTGRGGTNRSEKKRPYESLTGEVGLDDVDAFQFAAGGGGGARRRFHPRLLRK